MPRPYRTIRPARPIDEMFDRSLPTTRDDTAETVEIPDLKLQNLEPYDSAEFLSTPAHIAAHIEVVPEEDDPTLLARAIGVAARAHGMAEIARATGRSRESLSRAPSERGNP